MTNLKLAYIQRFKDRHGRVRFYFRRPGYDRVALPGLPGSSEFMAAYQAALARAPLPVGGAREAAGSLSHLIRAYYASPAWRALTGGTQRDYTRTLERLRAAHGHRLVREMQPKHVRALIAEHAAQPGQGNKLLSLLRLLLGHAAETGMRDDNPAREVRRLRYAKQPFTPWAEDHIAAFCARWPVGSRERLALDLLLFTGQRRGDVIRLGRQHLQGGRIRLRQSKTGAALTLPIHPDLAASLAAIEHDHLTFIVTSHGAPFASGTAFYNWFKWAAAKASLPENLSPHGLRKAAARRLAEAGCTPHEIAAVTGHATLAEVERYTRSADQARMAEAAMARITPGQKRPAEAKE